MHNLFKKKLNKKFIVAIVAFTVCIFLFLLVYVTSSSKFSLDNVIVCKNLDKNMSPIDIIHGETTSTDRAILCFDYSKANIGLTLRIVWYYNDKQITDNTFKLAKTDGHRSVALLSSTDNLLPKGAYCVKIFLGDEELKQVSFVIS